MTNYAEWLNREHGQCLVVAPTNRGSEDGGLPYPVYRYKSISTIVRKPYRMGLPRLDFGYRRKLKTLEADIIHAHSPFVAGSEALRYGRRLGVPVVGTIHTKFYNDFLEATHSKAFARYAVKKCVQFFERADAVWAVNEGTAEVLRGYGYTGPIEVMPNGCDAVRPSDPDALFARVNEKYNIGAEETVFLNVARQVWGKNLKTVLDAFALFTKNHPAKLIMAGEGMDAKDIRRYARDQGLGESVLFTGNIMDRELLFGVYMRALAFVFPSVYDNAPIVVREAAAMGTPSILVRGTDAAESFADNETVLLCENTPESVARRMEDIYTDEALRERVNAQCSHIAIPWREIVGRVVVRYGEIIEEHKSKAAGRKGK